jgi:oligoendopeptidase F
MSDNKKHIWNLSYLLNGDHDPQLTEKMTKVSDASYLFINKWKTREDYLKDPVVLKEALDEYNLLESEYGLGGTPAYYFELRSAQDQEDVYVKATLNKLTDDVLKIANDLEFFTHRISKIPVENQSNLLQSPVLEQYKHYLEILFKDAKYILSEKEEQLLNLKSTTSYSNWVRMTQDFLTRESRIVLDTDSKKKKKTFTEIQKLTMDKSKEVRDTSVKAFNDILISHLDTAEYEINSILQDKKVNDTLRNVSRPDLIRHIEDDIDSETVDALLKAVEENYSISHKYYELKAKLLRLPKLEYHEKNIDYGSIDNKEYPYDRAVQITSNVFKKLDPEFLHIFNTYIEKGLIDVFPRKGKTGGAFCTGGIKNYPGYVLLNHTNKIVDVMTLAHEMGHAINFELIRASQNALNFDSPTCTAEVASTFMEDFVLDEIEKEADNELRLSIMMKRLDEDVSAIMRQVACYKFEQDLHMTYREKGYLSKKEIGDIYIKHMKNYLGSFVNTTSGSENWWVYWSHIRMYFYVYSYASGQLISKSLQELYKKDNSYIRNIKTFLAAGSSDSPKNIFANLGIDISDRLFWNTGLGNINSKLDETWEFAKKLGKI